ncbi:MAG: hypothetical protein RBQ95_02075 [Paracholeplasma sp.]|nr:hypothetical protein [Paracholeplasma sp.]MDY3195623.1 hypothetical protein [Paracholeplasma sp.]
MLNLKQWQKISFLSYFLLAIILFIYALGFATNFAYAQTVGYEEFFNHAQKVNRVIYTFGLMAVALGGLNLMFESQKRKNYYISNLVLGLLSSLLFIVSAIMIVIGITPLMKEFIEAFGPEDSPARLAFVFNGGSYNLNTFIIGYVLSSVMVIISVPVAIVTIKKYQISANKRKAGK